jgi:hydrogenase maturation protease
MFRGDDAFGCLVARELHGRLPDNYEVIEHDGEPASLIEWWSHVDSVYLVDAVSSGAVVGTIFDFDLAIRSLPEEFNLYSTHAFGVPQAVELARALHRLPISIRFIGVEGESFDAGITLSAGVEAAKSKVIAMLMDQIKRE